MTLNRTVMFQSGRCDFPGRISGKKIIANADNAQYIYYLQLIPIEGVIPSNLSICR